MARLAVTVVGSGIFGLWQAFEFARRGHAVTLIEASPEPAAASSSRLAGAMLAPYCESEASEPVITELGLRGLALWRAACPHVVARGSLVLAGARDVGELSRFARLTRGHQSVDAAAISALEPDLAERFARGLFYADEAHLAPRPALAWLANEVRQRGAELRLGERIPDGGLERLPGEAVIDCRGIGARTSIGDLRGVRGEMLVLRAADVTLSRPVRLLHPRFPLYVVPWGEGLFMVGATVIEREDASPVTVRSALDLLGTAYTLHPSFAEAEIVEFSAGVRPSLPDNVPKVIVRGHHHLMVNGAYRHGFLLAPVMAELVATYLETGAIDDRVFVTERQNA